MHYKNKNICFIQFVSTVLYSIIKKKSNPLWPGATFVLLLKVRSDRLINHPHLESIVCLYFSWIKPTIESSDNLPLGVDIKFILKCDSGSISTQSTIFIMCHNVLLMPSIINILGAEIKWAARLIIELRGDFQSLVYFLGDFSFSLFTYSIYSPPPFFVSSSYCLVTSFTPKINRSLVFKSRFQCVLLKHTLILCIYDPFQLLLEEQAPLIQVRIQVSILRNEVSFVGLKRKTQLKFGLKYIISSWKRIKKRLLWEQLEG